MRGEEIRQGIDIYPLLSKSDKDKLAAEGRSESSVPSLGKSKKAATLAVSETAISRVLNSSPIMVIPPLILVRLQKQEWLKKNPRLTLPVNLGLILGTSLLALPLALAAFPQRQSVNASSLEQEFWGKGGEAGKVVFNRGIWGYWEVYGRLNISSNHDECNPPSGSPSGRFRATGDCTSTGRAASALHQGGTFRAQGVFMGKEFTHGA